VPSRPTSSTDPTSIRVLFGQPALIPRDQVIKMRQPAREKRLDRSIELVILRRQGQAEQAVATACQRTLAT
jgi:hypothetical protein